MPDVSLISTEGLSKPATVLIKKISDAVGDLWEPHQIRRVAEAEADAAITLAKAEIEIDQLRQRAARRFVNEQTRIQLNMESIARQGIRDVDPKAPTEDVDVDWISNFFDKCRLVSDDHMQALWSRILSGEANSPGSFSRKTVNLVADLDQPSAELFQALCSCGWKFGDVLMPLIFDLTEQIYIRHGISLFEVGHLDSIGLIQINATGGFLLTNQPKTTTAVYRDRTVNLTFPKNTGNDLNIGQVLLTPSGEQLSRIVKPVPIEGFFEFVYDRWAKGSLVPVRQNLSEA